MIDITDYQKSFFEHKRSIKNLGRNPKSMSGSFKLSNNLPSNLPTIKNKSNLSVLNSTKNKPSIYSTIKYKYGDKHLLQSVNLEEKSNYQGHTRYASNASNASNATFHHTRYASNGTINTVYLENINLEKAHTLYKSLLNDTRSINFEIDPKSVKNFKSFKYHPEFDLRYKPTENLETSELGSVTLLGKNFLNSIFSNNSNLNIKTNENIKDYDSSNNYYYNSANNSKFNNINPDINNKHRNAVTNQDPNTLNNILSNISSSLINKNNTTTSSDINNDNFNNRTQFVKKILNKKILDQLSKIKAKAEKNEAHKQMWDKKNEEIKNLRISQANQRTLRSKINKLLGDKCANICKTFEHTIVST